MATHWLSGLFTCGICGAKYTFTAPRESWQRKNLQHDTKKSGCENSLKSFSLELAELKVDSILMNWLLEQTRRGVKIALDWEIRFSFLEEDPGYVKNRREYIDAVNSIGERIVNKVVDQLRNAPKLINIEEFKEEYLEVLQDWRAYYNSIRVSGDKIMEKLWNDPTIPNREEHLREWENLQDWENQEEVLKEDLKDRNEYVKRMSMWNEVRNDPKLRLEALWKNYDIDVTPRLYIRMASVFNDHLRLGLIASPVRVPGNLDMSVHLEDDFGSLDEDTISYFTINIVKRMGDKAFDDEIIKARSERDEVNKRLESFCSL